MVRYSLKMINKLNKVEEKEKQIELKQAATAAMPSNSLTPNALVLGVETDPFVGLKVPLLFLKV
jgi:hypothetical protein